MHRKTLQNNKSGGIDYRLRMETARQTHVFLGALLNLFQYLLTSFTQYIISEIHIFSKRINPP